MTAAPRIAEALRMISAEAKEDNSVLGRSVYKALATCGELADMALAAIPAHDEKDAEIARLREALAARRVAKPLEWHKSRISSWNDDWHTITPVIFTIRCADENGWKWSGPGGFGYASSPAGAMADCQAECNRILAALSPT